MSVSLKEITVPAEVWQHLRHGIGQLPTAQGARFWQLMNDVEQANARVAEQKADQANQRKQAKAKRAERKDADNGNH